jgi:CheY-like chemotaxis protein
VLIAEDNAVNQRVTLKQLAKLGFAADAVANGLEVLSALQRVPYHIIIMDCQMPEMDGYEVTRRIRGSGRDSYIHLRSAPYIVALTANALPGDRERCFEAGMNDYLTKPLRLPDLEGVMQRALLSVGPAAPAAPLDPAADVLDRSILDGLRELREPDQPDPLVELIDLFLRDARPRLERMAAAAQAGDWPALCSSAHSLKGSANNLGARRLSSLCATLEKQGKANDGPQASATLAEVQSEFEKVELALKAELQK